MLAAAIRAGAQLIVTTNLRDFPATALDRFGIEAVHPDLFIEQQMDLHEGAVIGVAKQHRESLKNPPKTADEYLDTLAAQGPWLPRNGWPSSAIFSNAEILQQYGVGRVSEA